MHSHSHQSTGEHRAGMTTLFMTEMWERFSFYGMKALLVPFLMTAAIGYSESAAKEILGGYVLWVYLAPLFAAVIADRFMNMRQSIYVGAIVMAVGHFAMAFDGLIFVGMALIVAGNGFFKPCATNMVGDLYPEKHPWRTSAYSVFYFGINLGATLSPFVCGLLRDHYGFHYGFAAAGIGMLVGLLTFAAFEPKLGIAGLRPEEKRGESGEIRMAAGGWRKVALASAGTVVLVGGAILLIPDLLNAVWTPTWLFGETISDTVKFLVRMALVAVLLWVYVKAAPKEANPRPLTEVDRDRIKVIMAVSFAMFFLVIALEQSGGSLNLFAKNFTSETLFGVRIPYEFYQAVNPIWVMTLALSGAWFWGKVESKGVTDLHKLGPGLILVAVVFLLIQGAQSAAGISGVHDPAAAGVGTRVSPVWLIAIYFFIAAAEVCISVTGLSAVNKLAPAHMKAFFTAVFFMSIAVGGYLAGTIDGILKELNLPPWWTLAAVCIALGLVYMATAGRMIKLAHGALDTAKRQ
ncbi:MAG: MFS transporter [Candidatus Dadabacteria bacterium]|nr:MAG: MFS transporter [Candidatus Dadabacteria bacterium]